MLELLERFTATVTVMWNLNPSSCECPSSWQGCECQEIPSAVKLMTPDTEMKAAETHGMALKAAAANSTLAFKTRRDKF